VAELVCFSDSVTQQKSGEKKIQLQNSAAAS